MGGRRRLLNLGGPEPTFLAGELWTVVGNRFGRGILLVLHTRGRRSVRSVNINSCHVRTLFSACEGTGGGSRGRRTPFLRFTDKFRRGEKSVFRAAGVKRCFLAGQLLRAESPLGIFQKAVGGSTVAKAI